MEGRDRQRIVAGIAGEHCGAALEAAAEQARLRGMGVHLVHVVRLPTSRDLETADIARWAEDTERAERLMAGTATRLASLLDGRLPVTTAIWHGAPAPSLAAASEDAALIVVQHRRIARRSRGSLRSVTQALIAQTRAPVLVVPDDWRPLHQSSSRVVTVGLPSSNGTSGIVRAALAEADRQAARLLVVHAVGPDPSTEHAVDGSVAASRLRLHRLQQAVQYLAGERPDVPVEVLVVAEPAAEALAQAAATSTLVVVGRRHSRAGSTTGSGPVVNELLTRCSCPLLVVDPLEHGELEAAAAGQRQTST